MRNTRQYIFLDLHHFDESDFLHLFSNEMPEIWLKLGKNRHYNLIEELVGVEFRGWEKGTDHTGALLILSHPDLQNIVA